MGAGSRHQLAGPFNNVNHMFNTLRTGDADFRLYITPVQDG